MLNEQQKAMVDEYRNGRMLEADLIKGLSDEDAYNLIKSVRAIEKVVGLK